jgi:chemotaxis protein histidine kinase CheA
MARHRDLDVRFNLVGDEVPIEEFTAEILNQVFPQLLRFTMDYGFDTPEQRLRVNKSEHLTLTIACERQARQLLITLVDDGHGIDPKEMRRMAVEQQVMTNEQAAALSDQAAQELIFMIIHNAGDSSASGVQYMGLNVLVQRLRDDLAAEVMVQSTVDQGMAIKISIPLAR